MILTTLNRLAAHNPCASRAAVLLAGLGKTEPDDEPLPFARIVEINGLDDALWCCRAEPQHDREWRLFAVWCARQVEHLMTDPRSRAALDVAERYGDGRATDDELTGAWTAADVAQKQAWAAAAAEDSAVWAAWEAAEVAAAAAWPAMAARAAAWTARAARGAWAAARAEAGLAAKACDVSQTAKFVELVG